MSKPGRVDVSTHFQDGPYLGVGRYGGKTIYNYQSKRFGFCDMIVNTVEPEPMQEAIMYLLRLKGVPI
jgi:hypothetical protein